MEPRPSRHPRQAALVRASQLTTELIELVRQVRAAVADGHEQPALEASPVGARLQSGDLRAALSAASRRPARQVPHLFG